MSSHTHSSAKTAEAAWESLVAQFREACIAHHEGHTDEAARLTGEVLPGLIEDWSELETGARADKKKRLTTMFAEETRKIAEAALVQRLIVNRLAEEVIPQFHNSLHRERDAVRQIERQFTQSAEKTSAPQPQSKAHPSNNRRVPFNDICGMIDAVHGEQYGDTARRLVPLQSLAS